VTGYRLSPSAQRSVDEISDYTAERWGEDQADQYVQALFAEFALIVGRKVPWRALPSWLAISGFRRPWRHHIIYWRLEADGWITVVAVLHERMDQFTRVATAFGIANDD
jgi:toxin ParE1/3/4